MNTKRKTLFIQLAGLFICIACAVVGILWQANSTGEEQEEAILPSEQNQLVPQPPQHIEEYDPLDDIEDVKLPQADKESQLDYYTLTGYYNLTEPLLESGYSLSQNVFEPSLTRVALVPTRIDFPKELSQTDRVVQKPVTTEANRGGYYTEYEKVREDCPVLTPYYGYIIYTTKEKTMLMNSSCHILLDNIRGYEPAYMTDLCGNPLFVKDGKYYFFYSGKDYKGAAYSNVTKDTLKELDPTAPTAYEYFIYDKEQLHNLFVTNDFPNESNMTGMAYNLPNYAAMVEYKVDERTVIDQKLPSPIYTGGDGVLYKFPAYTYEKVWMKTVNDQSYYRYGVSEILWGYMDQKGNVVIKPQYKKAFDFNDGLAVVLDKHNHLCVINERGNTVYNAYNEVYYFSELGDLKVRDGHYLPDTFGKETLGMLNYDSGFIRMRRKLIDTANGYITKWEDSVLCDKEGKVVNIPSDCELISYSDGVMLLKKGTSYGYMNTNGAWITEPELKYAEPFCEGLAVMGYSADRLGVIDTQGNKVLYSVYSYISSCSGGVITAYSKEGGWTVFNKLEKSSGDETEEARNPIIDLKIRAIAEAKAEYYAPKEAEETTAAVKEDKK